MRASHYGRWVAARRRLRSTEEGRHVVTCTYQIVHLFTCCIFVLVLEHDIVVHRIARTGSRVALKEIQRLVVLPAEPLHLPAQDLLHGFFFAKTVKGFSNKFWQKKLFQCTDPPRSHCTPPSPSRAAAQTRMSLRTPRIRKATSTTTAPVRAGSFSLCRLNNVPASTSRLFSMVQ